MYRGMKLASISVIMSISHFGRVFRRLVRGVRAKCENTMISLKYHCKSLTRTNIIEYYEIPNSLLAPTQVRHWERIDRLFLLLEAENKSTKADLQEEVEEHRDFLYYVQDVMAIQISGFQDTILDMFRDRVLRPVIQNLISSPSSPSSPSSKTMARKNVPTILPPNIDLNVFQELPLSIQEEHINQYRDSYRMEARKEAIEYCQNRVLTPRELMRPVTCSQRKNQEIERLHKEYKSAKRDISRW